LLYLASKKGNAKFNSIIGWIPAVKGAPLPSNWGIRPQLQGQFACFNPLIGVTPWSNGTSYIRNS